MLSNAEKITERLAFFRLVFGLGVVMFASLISKFTNPGDPFGFRVVILIAAGWLVVALVVVMARYMRYTKPTRQEDGQ